MTMNEYLLLLFHVEQVKQIYGKNSVVNTKYLIVCQTCQTESTLVV